MLRGPNAKDGRSRESRALLPHCHGSCASPEREIAGATRDDEPRATASEQDRRGEARAMLAEIYGWFTEGFDTADKEARAARRTEGSAWRKIR